MDDGGRAPALHRQARPHLAAGRRGDRLGGAADRAPQRAHRLRRVRLRRPRRDPARGRALSRRRGGGVPPPSLRARISRTRSSSSAPEASCAFRTSFSGRPPTRSLLLGALWPEFDREEFERALDSLRRPGVPLRRPVTARARTGGDRRRRAGTSTGARVWVAIPWIVFAIAIVHFGGTVFAVAARRPRVRRPARALRDASDRCARSRSRGSRAPPA